MDSITGDLSALTDSPKILPSENALECPSSQLALESVVSTDKTDSSPNHVPTFRVGAALGIVNGVLKKKGKPFLTKEQLYAKSNSELAKFGLEMLPHEPGQARLYRKI